MKIFVLKPEQREIENPLWRNTTYQKIVIIRSESELLARSHVADVMQLKQSVNRGEHDSPWLDASLVLCEEFQGDIYTVEGIPEILYPENISDK